MAVRRRSSDKELEDDHLTKNVELRSKVVVRNLVERSRVRPLPLLKSSCGKGRKFQKIEPRGPEDGHV